MASVCEVSCVEQIGDTAGQVWHFLNENGATTFTRLVKDVDANRDVLMQALGWLAREGKISIDEQGRTKTVTLR